MAVITWDRKAKSIAAMDGDGLFRFAVLPQVGAGAYRSDIVCGLTNSTGTAPDGVSHGFMIRGDSFCVLENGAQVSGWQLFPEFEGLVEAVVFRIYRVNSDVFYTVSAAPEATYTASGWENGLWAPWDDAHQYDFDAHAAKNALDGLSINGALVHSSTQASTTTAYLAVAFSRLPQDEYGELGTGEIYGASLLFPEAADTQPSMLIPALQILAGDLVDGVRDELPPLQILAAEYNAYGIRASLSALQVIASELSPLDVQVEYMDADIPALAMRFEDNAPSIQMPAVTCKAGDFDRMIETIPAITMMAGDGLEGVLAEIPALHVQSTEEYSLAGSIYGAVPIYPRLSASSMVIDPSALPTKPMTLLAKIDGAVFGENALPTKSMRLIAKINGQATAIRTLPTEPMVLGATGSITSHAEVTLPTQPMKLIAGGDISAIGIVTLPTEPMVLLAGGKIGQRSAVLRTYAMSLQGGGTTEYKEFPFNSFAKINGQYYGASEEGLFLLEGNTDNGAPIQSEFGFGEFDFGTPKMKTISYCYLGTAAGSMKMRVYSHVNGKPAGYEYKARLHGRSIREVRFDLGRGLKSTYVMPTFYNANGHDFEVDHVRFLVSNSDRRI